MERILGPGTVMVRSGSAAGVADPGKTLQWLSTNGRTWICMTSGAGSTGIWVERSKALERLVERVAGYARPEYERLRE